MNRISRAALGVTLIALTVLLTACGKESATPGAAGVESRKVVVSATQTGKRATARPVTDPPPIARLAPSCGSANTEAVVAPGEAPSEQIWDSGIVVTNRGSAPCTLQGVSKIEFYTGGDGRPLGIRAVAAAGAPADLVILNPGEQATMAMVVHTTAVKPVPADCLEGASFAQVTLPGDAKDVEAWLPDRSGWMPPVCGAVEVSPWGKGGAPGVK